MKFKFTVILVLFVNISFSQQWLISGRIGYGFYEMHLLRDFQEFRVKQSNLPLLTKENYPVTPSYRLELSVNDLNFIDKIGAFYTFNTTGSRSTLSDYSGRIDLDAIINGHQLGLTFHKMVEKNKSVSNGIYIECSYLISSLKLKDYISLNAPSYMYVSNEYKLNSSGFSTELGMVAKYVIKPLDIQLNLGYLHDFSGKLYLGDNKKQWLGLNNSVIKTGWSGMRLGMQISYQLKRKLKV